MCEHLNSLDHHWHYYIEQLTTYVKCGKEVKPINHQEYTIRSLFHL